MWACFALMKSDLIGCSLSVGLGFFILEKLAIAAAAEVLDDKEEEDLEQKKIMSSSDHVTSTTPYVSGTRFFFLSGHPWRYIYLETFEAEFDDEW